MDRDGIGSMPVLSRRPGEKTNEEKFMKTVNEWFYKYGADDIQGVIKVFKLPDLADLPVRPYWMK